MLTGLRMNNCLIYNSEIEFSMHANMHYKKFPNAVATIGKNKILKTAVLIGPNNTGKTNFIRVIAMMKSIMLNQRASIKRNLFSDSSICELAISFIHEGKEYSFEIKYDISKEEYVYERFTEIKKDTYKNRKECEILVRDCLNSDYRCKDDELVPIMKVAAKSNILIYLMDTDHFSVLKKIKDVIISFASKIDIVDMNNIPIKKTIDIMKSTNSQREKIVGFVRNADLSLDDFRFLNDDELSVSITNHLTSPETNRPQESALNVPDSLMEMLHLASFYRGIAVPSVIFDSTGTKKIAALASYVIDALENNRILIIDELDNSLHFRLTRAIIALFNNELNSSAQLIATVHDISLLDCQTLFRKEQIWFTHKDRDNVYLYSLSDFTAEKNGIRDTSDLIEKYRSGVLGAIPEPDLFASLLEVHENV